MAEGWWLRVGRRFWHRISCWELVLCTGALACCAGQSIWFSKDFWASILNGKNSLCLCFPQCFNLISTSSYNGVSCGFLLLLSSLISPSVNKKIDCFSDYSRAGMPYPSGYSDMDNTGMPDRYGTLFHIDSYLCCFSMLPCSDIPFCVCPSVCWSCSNIRISHPGRLYSMRMI